MPRPGSGARGGCVAGLVHLREEVLASPERGQVGVHDGGGRGDALGAADVRVAQVVGQLVEVVSSELVVILDDSVVAWSARACNGRGKERWIRLMKTELTLEIKKGRKLIRE